MAWTGRILDFASRLAPGQLAALIDGLRPSLADGFGGPFNGQQRRIEAVREMFAAIDFQTVFETGTYRGTTTAFLRELCQAPIATIEAQSRYYHYARRRFRRAENVSVMRGDSATRLRRLSQETPWRGTPAFFYLDAHWLEHLPLVSEVSVINECWRDAAVLIDDFRVPHDPGYAYDSYPGGGQLDISLLAPVLTDRLIVYWPASSASEETGAQRGWLLLSTSGLVDDQLRNLRSLRRAGPLGALESGGVQVEGMERL